MPKSLSLKSASHHSNRLRTLRSRCAADWIFRLLRTRFCLLLHTRRAACGDWIAIVFVNQTVQSPTHEPMLYDQGISLSRSGYPTCLYLEKIDSRPPGAQKRSIWPLGGPFSGHRAGFWPENSFFAIGPWILSMARL